jgi:tetratricopeptide (TPR) repeat protein
MHEGLDAMAPVNQDKALRAFWNKGYDWVVVQKVSASYDKASGIEHLTMDGAANMKWDWDDNTRTWRYETDNTRLGWSPYKPRQPGPHADAPFSIGYPIFTHAHEDIVLPKKGTGFAIDGEAIDKTMGGSAFKRTLAITGDAMHIDATARTLTPEISAAEEASSRAILRNMYDKAVYLVAPEGYKAGAGDAAKLPGNTSRSPADLVNEAAELRRQGKDDQALGRYNQALELDPTNAKALLGRAQVFFLRKAYAASLADAQQAIKSDPALYRAWDLIAVIDLQANKQADALDAFTKAIAIYPNDTFALAGRAAIYGEQGDFVHARADALAIVQIDPGNTSAIRILAALDLQAGHPDQARDRVRAAIEANPDSADLYMLLGQLDDDCSGLTREACVASKADAEVQYGKAIAIQPTALAYAMRAQDRPAAEAAARFDDLAQAIKLQPQWDLPYLVRSAIYLNDKDYDKALADANKAIELNPKDSQAYLIREQVYFAQGKTALALADIDALLARAPSSPQYLNESCWERATHNVELDKALEACNAAVKAAPKSAAILDSRGFVQLRLGHYDLAIADYDAALLLEPNQGNSLYGRGVAKLRKGMSREGQADIDAARRLYPKIDEAWTRYGIKP